MTDQRKPYDMEYTYTEPARRGIRRAALPTDRKAWCLVPGCAREPGHKGKCGSPWQHDAEACDAVILEKERECR